MVMGSYWGRSSIVLILMYSIANRRSLKSRVMHAAGE